MLSGVTKIFATLVVVLLQILSNHETYAINVTIRGEEGDWLALFLKGAMEGFPEWVQEENLDPIPPDPKTYEASSDSWSSSPVKVTMNITNQYFEGYSNPDLYEYIEVYGRLRDWEDVSMRRYEVRLNTEGVVFGGYYEVFGNVTTDDESVVFQSKGNFRIQTDKMMQYASHTHFTITQNMTFDYYWPLPGAGIVPYWSLENVNFENLFEDNQGLDKFADVVKTELARVSTSKLGIGAPEIINPVTKMLDQYFKTFRAQHTFFQVK